MASNVSFQILGNNFKMEKAEKCIGDVWIHAGFVKRQSPTTANEGFNMRPIHMITGE
jgi:hypothetical protein